MSIINSPQLGYAIGFAKFGDMCKHIWSQQNSPRSRFSLSTAHKWAIQTDLWTLIAYVNKYLQNYRLKMQFCRKKNMIKCHWAFSLL